MIPQLKYFVCTVKHMNANDCKRQELTEFLSNQSEILVKYVDSLDIVLGALDEHKNSLAILTVLDVKAKAPKPDNVSEVQYYTTIATQMNDFVTKVTVTEIRELGEPLANVMKSILNNLKKINKTMSAIPILKYAISKLQETPDQITQLHYVLCQACLMSNNLKPALSLLEQDVYVLDNSKDEVEFDPNIFLSYYYLGGVIYTAMKNYSRALKFFEIAVVILFPEKSQITIESYKKFVLVSIIHLGTIPEIPKSSLKHIDRLIKPSCKAYVDLISAFKSNDLVELQRTVVKYNETYQRDKNKGLVKQVIKIFPRKNIIKLSNAFMNMSISNLAQRVSLSSSEEAEEHLMTMIKSGEIHCKINMKEGTIMFNDPPKKYQDSTVLNRIIDEVNSKISFGKTVQKLNEAILMDPSFVKKDLCLINMTLLE